jgi:anthranilate phosphoribosyltransferase
MKALLNRLFEFDKLDREEAKTVLLQIADGQFNPVQVASFVTVFNMRPIYLTELQGFRDALLELCVPVDFDGMETIDIVGTGGDGKNTFNISTLTCVVVAGAGYKVSKHGSYGVSSSVGSSDVLLELGYEFTNNTDILRSQLDAANICFLHAPFFHPALKEVAPIRKQLGMKTFFNMLGPLVNPIQPTNQMFGTFSLELSRMYQYIMQPTGRRFSIIYAMDGYDEISLTGAFKLRNSEGEFIISPEDIGLREIQPEELYGGETAADAAAIFKNVLSNEATDAQKEVVLANAGFAIQTIHPEKSIEDCIAEAKESIESGNALEVLKKLLAK